MPDATNYHIRIVKPPAYAVSRGGWSDIKPANGNRK
jgi:hypothetical protein